MLTGDTKIYAEKVARDLGIDSFEAELLPKDKIKFFEKEQLLVTQQTLKSAI